jgi:hypothetical protein
VTRSAPNTPGAEPLSCATGNSLWGIWIVTKLILRLRGILIALAALALSAGLAFGAQPDASLWGLANASSQAGQTVPVQAGDEETTGDETTDESTDESTDETTDETTSEDSSDHCATDPTTLTPEELAAANHGSVVCWAAQQTQWPEWFSNHGAFVACWAHSGKADATDCTVAPAPEAAAATHGKGKGNGKGHNK